jgi:GxxExxY protein
MTGVPNDLTEVIIGAAIAVHRELGPGLLESTNEACLVHELRERGLEVEQQKLLAIHYRGIRIDCAYRIDLLVEDRVIVELKAIDQVLPIHEAQILSYLRLSGYKLGLLINFNVTLLKDGVRRFID